MRGYLQLLLGLLVTLSVLVTLACTPQPPPPGDGGQAAECTSDEDCTPNEVCEDFSCVASPDPQVEVGFTDLDSGTYRVITDGQVMPLFTAFQGGSHIFVTLRAAGFPHTEDGTVDVVVAQIVTRLDSGDVLNEFIQTIPFTAIEESRIERESRFVFLDATPEDLDGQTVMLSFTLTEPEDGSIFASITQTVVLEPAQE